MDRAVRGTVVAQALPAYDSSTEIASSYRCSAEDFRPQDGQSLLARFKHARKYAKEADKALQNIEVVCSGRARRATLLTPAFVDYRPNATPVSQWKRAIIVISFRTHKCPCAQALWSPPVVLL